MADEKARIMVPLSAEITEEQNERLEAWRASLPAQTSRSAVVRALLDAGLAALAAPRAVRAAT